MKKALTLALTLLMAAGIMMLCACSSDKVDTQEETGGATGGVPNPLEESSEEGLIEITGIDLPAPEGAENVEYFYYRIEPPLAEMRFTLNGTDAVLRGQPTDLTSFPLSGEEVLESIRNGEFPENAADISGMYYSWDYYSSQNIKGCEAQCFLQGDAGIICWIDVVPGVAYSISMEYGATEERLLEMANAAFVPLQGNA